MSGKKIAFIIITVFAILVLLIVGFVCALVFGVNATIKNSDSYKTAISYIEADPEIAGITGEITGYGFFAQGNVSTTNGYGDAEYTIKAIGQNRDLKIWITLKKEPWGSWEVTDCRFERFSPTDEL